MELPPSFLFNLYINNLYIHITIKSVSRALVSLPSYVILYYLYYSAYQPNGIRETSARDLYIIPNTNFNIQITNRYIQITNLYIQHTSVCQQ